MCRAFAMEVKPEIAGTSVVVLGSFNPAIVQPAWLAKNGLVPPSEAESVDLDAVHDEFVRASFPWGTVQTMRDRFEVSTTDEAPSAEPIRDLAVGALDLLPHTPVTGFGINHWAHYRTESEEAWHALGFRLVPRSNWEGILEKPGMLAASVRGVRPDDRPGAVNVTVQPSGKVAHGVFVTVNDHFALKTDDEEHAASEASTLLKAVWNDSVTMARQIHVRVMEGPHAD